LTKPNHVVIVEDDPVISESLVSFLGIAENMQVVKAFQNAEAFIEWLKKHHKKKFILLLDIQLPGKTGIESLPYIQKISPDLDVIILTTFEETDIIFKALRAGACSYVSKRTPLQNIKEAVEIVAKGGSYMSPAIARKIANFYAPKNSETLTDRQNEIVNGIVNGKSYKMIAKDLFISHDTVRSHIKIIYSKLKINSKAQLIKKSFDNEL